MSWLIRVWLVGLVEMCLVLETFFLQQYSTSESMCLQYNKKIILRLQSAIATISKDQNIAKQAVSSKKEVNSQTHLLMLLLLLLELPITSKILGQIFQVPFSF